MSINTTVEKRRNHTAIIVFGSRARYSNKLDSTMECPTCKRTFNHVGHYNRHVEGHKGQKEHCCGKCGKAFARTDNKLQHERNCKKGDQSSSSSGGSGIMAPPPRQRKVTKSPNNFKIEKTKTAFSNATITWKLDYPTNDGKDFVSLITASTLAMQERLEKYRSENHALKFNMSLHLNFEQAVDPSIVTTPPAVLVSEQFEAYADTNINELLHEASKQLENRIECYEGTGSGWVVSNLVALDTTVWRLDPLRASTYHPLPTWIQNTLCVVNIKNKDQKCFQYAVLAALYKPSSSTNPSSVYSYTYTESLDDVPSFDMMEFPVTLRSIDRFEKANNISVNVYAVEETKKDQQQKGNNLFFYFHTYFCKKKKLCVCI